MRFDAKLLLAAMALSSVIPVVAFATGQIVAAFLMGLSPSERSSPWGRSRGPDAPVGAASFMPVPLPREVFLATSEKPPSYGRLPCIGEPATA
jgi:hypothetical protein